MLLATERRMGEDLEGEGILAESADEVSQRLPTHQEHIKTKEKYSW